MLLGDLPQFVEIEAGGPDHDAHSRPQALPGVRQRLVGNGEVDDHVRVARDVG